MSTQLSPHHRRAVLILLVVTAFWGLSFPLMKAAGLLAARQAPDANTWVFTGMMLMPRYILASVILAIVLGPALRNISRLECKQGLLIGGFASGGMLFQADGLQFTETSTSAFLSQFYVIIIPVWIAVRSRRNPGKHVWIACSLVLAGVAVLGRFDLRELYLGRGETETLIASVFFTGQILVLAQPGFALNHVVPVTLVMFLVQAALFTLLSVVTALSLEALVAPLSSLTLVGLHHGSYRDLHFGSIFIDEPVAKRGLLHRGGIALLRGADLELCYFVVPTGVIFSLGGHQLSQ